jgi:hypothetical protein
MYSLGSIMFEISQKKKHLFICPKVPLLIRQIWMYQRSNTTGATNVAGIGYSSRLHELIPFELDSRRSIFNCQLLDVDQCMKQTYLYRWYPLFQAQWNICDQ